MRFAMFVSCVSDNAGPPFAAVCCKPCLIAATRSLDEMPFCCARSLRLVLPDCNSLISWSLDSPKSCATGANAAWKCVCNDVRSVCCGWLQPDTPLTFIVSLHVADTSEIGMRRDAMKHVARVLTDF